MGAQQPPAIMPCSDADQAVYPQRQHTHQHLQLQRPPPSQVYQSFQPPNRSHPSPKPGGYPADRVMVPVARAPAGSRSPTASVQTSTTRPSPQYPPPPPSAAQMPAAPSYPPPPFSPISQFRSPPPPVPRQFQAPLQSNLLGSCPSKAEENSGIVYNTNDKKTKDTLDEVNERLRSVSYSSDKFPPASLNLARVSHQDQLPLSPSYTMSGVVPLPANVDTSVPPPSLPTPPPSLSPPPVSFQQAKKRAWRIPRSPRISVSEISDMITPLPVRNSKTSSNNIKFSLTRNRNDHVFHG